jgi:hypothetical protein
MRKKSVIIMLVLGLLLTSCASKGNTSTSAAALDKTDISSALNLVLGSTDRASVFSSYHIELVLDSPVLGDDNVTITNETTKISADVEGSNIHIIQTDPGATESKEGYIIGETEYKIVDGAKVDTNGMIGLAWAMWPLKVVIPYAWSVNYSSKTGTDTIDGRKADVYTFDSANAPADVQAYISSADATGTTSAKGTVWIDQETGAMLKLEMSYSENFSDNDGKVVGSGTGNVSLEITKVNQTTVVEP